MAVLTSVLATALLAAVGLTLALLGAGEERLAARDRDIRAMSAALDGAVAIAVSEANRIADWTHIVAPGAVVPLAATPAGFLDASVTPVPPWGGPPIDLALWTTRVQADSDAERAAGADPVTWHLFASGALQSLVPSAGANPFYLAIWIADDGGDGDGDAATDRNGVVLLQVDVFGPTGANMAAIATARKGPHSLVGVRRLD